jgi:hypothetical protein
MYAKGKKMSLNKNADLYLKKTNAHLLEFSLNCQILNDAYDASSIFFSFPLHRLTKKLKLND